MKKFVPIFFVLLVFLIFKSRRFGKEAWVSYLRELSYGNMWKDIEAGEDYVMFANNK